MKIIFKIGEDDARNPGVIADCTGDNAGDSVGPTADGFETYGVTGVALISFIVLAAGMMYAPNGELTQMAGGIDIQARLIVWIFTMRVLMIITSVVSYLLNNGICKAVFGKAKAFNFETPLTSLVWLTSLISILVTFGVSYVMIGDMGEDLWWKLSVIISCGTFAAAIIPEFTKIFTSSKSKHVQEIVNASREAGASLNIISGIVAGNFSAFWKGLVMVGLMVIAFFAAREGLDAYMVYPTVFAFGLVAFGMLGMGPVTIAVDSYGPVTDNAQSVFELSQIEQIKGIDKQINCYSMVPWELSFQYYDQATNSLQFVKTAPGEAAYEEMWGAMLASFSKHLKEKGWFDICTIAMDERPMDVMQKTLKVIRKADPDFKVSLAGNYHAEIEPDLYDYCIVIGQNYPEDVRLRRKAENKRTTYYTCCTEAHPNTFTFSDPAEAAWMSFYSSKKHLDGYLRWAYNSWPLEPLLDSRFRTWAAGDTYLAYPGARSCIRFERLIEGVQAHEKINILRQEFEKNGNKAGLKKIEKMLAPFNLGDMPEIPAAVTVNRANQILNSF